MRRHAWHRGNLDSFQHRTHTKFAKFGDTTVKLSFGRQRSVALHPLDPKK